MESGKYVVCMGELLIDFFSTEVGIDLTRATKFQKQAGGAPANVCTTVVDLGGDAVFSGKVGNDSFGHFLKNTLEEQNVDTSLLILDETASTTLAFVSLQENGERDFVFNRGADVLLHEEDLDIDRLNKAAIMHFGSATALLDDPFLSTYLNTMQKAKRNGQFISFDPNYRKDLWKGDDFLFIERVNKVISLADFVKVSEEELVIISGEKDIYRGIEKLHNMGCQTLAVTMGSAGTFISNGKTQELVPSIKVKAIDTTGAGDAFVGAMLYQFLQEKDLRVSAMDFGFLKKITAFSNKVGARVCTEIGAIPSSAEAEI